MQRHVSSIYQAAFLEFWKSVSFQSHLSGTTARLVTLQLDYWHSILQSLPDDQAENWEQVSCLAFHKSKHSTFASLAAWKFVYRSKSQLQLFTTFMLRFQNTSATLSTYIPSQLVWSSRKSCWLLRMTLKFFGNHIFALASSSCP